MTFPSVCFDIPGQTLISYVSGTERQNRDILQFTNLVGHTLDFLCTRRASRMYTLVHMVTHTRASPSIWLVRTYERGHAFTTVVMSLDGASQTRTTS